MAVQEIAVDTTDGFIDFRFPVLSARIAEDGEADLLLGGILFGRTAELALHVSAGLLPSDLFSDEPVIHSLSDGLQIRVVKPQGAHLLSEWSRLYGKPRTSFQLPIEVSCLIVALKGNPAHIATEALELKLFHETGSTDDDEGPMYFEMFCNIDIPAGYVEIKEKDVDFRSGVLASFSTEIV